MRGPKPSAEGLGRGENMRSEAMSRDGTWWVASIPGGRDPAAVRTGRVAR